MVEKYLRGTRCKSIYFNTGSCTLFLSKDEDSFFKDGFGNLIRIELTDIIDRFYDDETNELIEVQIKRKLYMMRPNGSFIYEQGYYGK